MVPLVLLVQETKRVSNTPRFGKERDAGGVGAGPCTGSHPHA